MATMLTAKKKLVCSAFAAAVGVAAAAGSYAIADASKGAKGDKPAAAAAPAGQPEMKLPPGFTEADMQACVAAGTPGKQHEHLAKGAGTWECKTTMWMAPGAEPVTSGGTSTVTPFLDGRFTKVEMKGEMPGMGPYHGFGTYGFDNVQQKFVATWLDNHGTGIMHGTGDLSADGKVLTWTFHHTCPITKKPVVMREVETITGENTRTLEMYGTPPKGDKEYKMMSIAMTRKP